MSDTTGPRPTDEQAWRELAKAATPGPWEAVYSDSTHRDGSPICKETCGTGRTPDSVSVGAEGELHTFRLREHVEDVVAGNRHVICFGHDYDEYGYMLAADAAYIAHSSPDRVLALLDDLATLRAEKAAMIHHEALIEARTQRGITDCSTPLFVRVENIVAQLEAAEASRDALTAQVAALTEVIRTNAHLAALPADAPQEGKS